MAKRKTETILNRLMRRSHIPTNKDGTYSKSKCWTWSGPTNNAGYGMMKVSKKLNMATVHRIMYIEHFKTINYGEKVQVLHKCGEKLCVNPHHLMLGGNDERAELQRKYQSYNPMFNDKERMWVTCEYCGNTDFLPHFKRKHSLCQHLLTHKYITDSISGKNR